MRIDLPQRNLSFEKDELLKELKYYKNDIIFLSGSLIEGVINKTSMGMGNCFSDIDIFILAEDIDSYNGDDVTYEKKNIKAHFQKFKGVSVDIEIYDKKLIRDLLGKLSQIDFSDINQRTYNLLELPSEFDINLFLSFVHRLTNSIVIYNELEYREIRKNVDKDKYHRFMRRFYMNSVENNYEDVVGNIENSQGEVAVTIARTMILKTIGAYIFFKNESIDREKWIPLKLKNLSSLCKESKDIYNQFCHLYFNSSLLTHENRINNAEELLMLSNSIISKIDSY